MGAPAISKEDTLLLDADRALEEKYQSVLKKDVVTEDSSSLGQLLLVFCISAFVFNQISFSQLPAFLPDYAERVVGVSPSLVGVILGTQGVCGMAANLIAPALISRFANLPCLVVGQAVLAAATLAFGLTGESLGHDRFVVVAIVLRSIQGLSDGVVQVAATSLILRSVPEQTTGMFVGLAEGLRSIGTLLGPMIGGLTYGINRVGARGNFKFPIVLLGSFLLLHASAFLLLCGTMEHSKIARTASRSSLTTVFSFPQCAVVVISCALCVFTLGFYEPTLLPYLTSAPFHLTTGQVGLLMTGTSLVMGVTAAVAGERLPMPSPPPLLPCMPRSAWDSQLHMSAGPAQYVCGQLVQTTFGVLLTAGSMALLGFVSPFDYPQFTVVAYIVSSASVMVIFVSAAELLVRVLRTFDIDPAEHAEGISAGVSFSFTSGLTSGTLLGGVLSQHLGFRESCRVIFFVVVSLPAFLIIPFLPVFMNGKTLAKSLSNSKSKHSQQSDEESR